MARLVLTPASQADLLEIAAYIEAESYSLDTAQNFVERLVVQCEKLASLSVLMGRSRPELLVGIRSFPYAKHVIFFRYLESDDSREILEVVNILRGSRDIDAFFQDRNDDVR